VRVDWIQLGESEDFGAVWLLLLRWRGDAERLGFCPDVVRLLAVEGSRWAIEMPTPLLDAGLSEVW
jgi:hypothetical protein